jgi:co-chaperonin GroES (HSP10)
MSSTRKFAACLALGIMVNVALQAQQQPSSQPAPAQSGQRISKIGAIKSIDGRSLVLKPDSGPDIAVTLTSDARLMRLGPGQTDLKSAEAITLKDVQVGDRILVRGQQGETPDSILGFSAVIMKQSDVAQKQQQEMQDWQRRGAGGIVSAIDAASGTLAVDVNPTLKVAVKTSPATRFLRYAPDSVRFSDAQKSSLDQIKTGDQLRARGTRSADGKELAAEEVISGTFRNIAGTIINVDAAAGTVTVKDVLAKKTVTVKLTGDSMMRKLPAQMAQRIAFFLKAPEAAQAAAAGANGSGPAAGGAGGGRAPDFQQMISRLPAVTIVDLQKEEAVMIVSTPGAGGSQVTAITLLGGVEPIITASPSSAAALLGGWNLSAPSGDAGPQ